MKRRALIISGRGVQDQELVYPYYRLQGAGYEVTLAAESTGEFLGIQGVKFSPNSEFMTESDVPAELKQYRMLVIPGGVKCMEHMRLNKGAVFIVAQFYNSGHGIVASICSGAQMLISAKVVKGRKIAAYHAMRDDVENAGATFVDGVSIDLKGESPIVTAPHYRDLGPWMEAALDEARRGA